MQCSAGLCCWLKQKPGDALCSSLGWVLCQRGSTCHANWRKAKQKSFAWLMNMLFGWREPSSFSTSLMAVLPFSVVSLACMHHELKKMGTANTFQTIPRKTIKLLNLIILSSGYLTESFHQKMWKPLKQCCVHRKTSSRALSVFIIPRELRT